MQCRWEMYNAIALRRAHHFCCLNIVVRAGETVAIELLGMKCMASDFWCTIYVCSTSRVLLPRRFPI